MLSIIHQMSKSLNPPSPRLTNHSESMQFADEAFGDAPLSTNESAAFDPSITPYVLSQAYEMCVPFPPAHIIARVGLPRAVLHYATLWTRRGFEPLPVEDDRWAALEMLMAYRGTYPVEHGQQKKFVVPFIGTFEADPFATLQGLFSPRSQEAENEEPGSDRAKLIQLFAPPRLPAFDAREDEGDAELIVLPPGRDTSCRSDPPQMDYPLRSLFDHDRDARKAAIERQKKQKEEERARLAAAAVPPPPVTPEKKASSSTKEKAKTRKRKVDVSDASSPSSSDECPLPSPASSTESLPPPSKRARPAPKSKALITPPESPATSSNPSSNPLPPSIPAPSTTSATNSNRPKRTTAPPPSLRSPLTSQPLQKKRPTGKRKTAKVVDANGPAPKTAARGGKTTVSGKGKRANPTSILATPPHSDADSSRSSSSSFPSGSVHAASPAPSSSSFEFVPMYAAGLATPSSSGASNASSPRMVVGGLHESSMQATVSMEAVCGSEVDANSQAFVEVTMEG